MRSSSHTLSQFEPNANGDAKSKLMQVINQMYLSFLDAAELAAYQLQYHLAIHVDQVQCEVRLHGWTRYNDRDRIELNLLLCKHSFLSS